MNGGLHFKRVGLDPEKGRSLLGKCRFSLHALRAQSLIEGHQVREVIGTPGQGDFISKTGAHLGLGVPGK